MKYFRLGNRITFGSIDAEPLDNLPPLFYTLEYSLEQGFYLRMMQKEMEGIPESLHGNIEKHADRMINTFNQKEGNMGILLSGIKGTGKTLMAKLICKKMGVPVINIAQGYKGAEFQAALTSIRDECIILFDEFEKHYDRVDDQHDMLSIMSGVFSGRKLFILTCNSLELVSPFMINRTERIRYHIKYTGLKIDEIKRVLYTSLEDDVALSPKMLAYIANMLYGKLKDVTYDILHGLCSEIRLYPELSKTPEGMKELMEIFNISQGSTTYTMSFNFMSPKFPLDGDESEEELKAWHSAKDALEYNVFKTVNFNPLTSTYNRTVEGMINNPHETHMSRFYSDYYDLSYNSDEYDIIFNEDGDIIATSQKDPDFSIKFKKNVVKKPAVF